MTSETWLIPDFLAVSSGLAGISCPRMNVLLSLGSDRQEARNGIRAIHFTLQKRTPSREELRWIISFLRLQHLQRKRVVLLEGNRKGVGRIVAASLLLTEGWSLSQVFAWIRRIGSDPLTVQEERLLSSFPKQIQAKRETEAEHFLFLLQTMRILRRRCPWDREQTHRSLIKYLIEESWELGDAVERESFPSIAEELGDVLLQVLFHSAIADEKGQFKIDDVLEGITTKLIRRHPHIFAKTHQATSSEVLAQWQDLKMEEAPSRGDRYRRYMPALLRAERLQEEASHRGMDWKEVNGVWEKVWEEVRELRDALSGENEKRVCEEFGDLLFTLVNLSRFLQLNPEKALHDAIDKFWHRIHRFTQKAATSGSTSRNLSQTELGELWDEIKKEER